VPDAWTGAARTVALFVRSQNRLPEPGPYGRESILSEWLKGQRRAAQKGRLDAAKMELLDRDIPGWRLSHEDRWKMQLGALALSMRTGDPLDDSLRQWLLAQRRALADGTLKPERREALDRDVPGWQENSDHQWRSRAEDLADYVDLNRTTPPYVAGESETAVLYRWMNYQRFLARSGKLPKKRLDWLNKNVPDWLPADSGRDGAWSAMADRVVDFLAVHGRWPVASREEERRMARWLGTQRGACRRGKLAAPRLAWLNAKLPGWNTPQRRRNGGTG
jgi:hypothetical protein